MDTPPRPYKRTRRSKWTSRKWWSGLVGASAPYVAQYLTESLGWDRAAVLSTIAIVSYILGEAVTDRAHGKSP